MIWLRAAVCAAIFMAVPLMALSSEPASGIYAADCANPKQTFSIEIFSNGTATVIHDGAIYPDLLTSYSFFGKATPANFHIAVLFDRDRTPLPQDRGGASWIEIWKGEAAFYALPNGYKDQRLFYCAELPATEAPGPDFDCSKAHGEVEKLICSDKELARRDWALAAVYRKALERITGDDAQMRSLKAEQRGWLKGRNDCWKARDARACVSATYSDRHATLLARFGLIKAGSRQVWTCDGMANSLFVTLFMTEPPTVNLVRGDETTTAIRRPVASGLRYEAPFGVYFWIEGKEATLEWPEGESLVCRYSGIAGKY